MRLVCISDTHGQHNKMPPIPEGDVLVHAGDCTGSGTLPQIDAFTKWLGALPHAHKILIAGNHDFCFDKNLRGKSMAAQSRSMCEQNNITYLRIGIFQRIKVLWISLATDFPVHGLQREGRRITRTSEAHS